MTAIILSLSNLTVVAAVVIFLALTLLLVVILLVAKARLMPAGNRRITINGERTVETPAGATLLASLASNKIFLPSACGGGGSCGMCRCRVLSGGGEILPTETGFFTRKQQQEHYRLACQVKVKNDLQIQVPQPILGIKKMECEVVSNRNVASFIKEFVVRVPQGEKSDFLPGSYVQIDVPRYDIKFTDMEVDDKFRDEWDKYKMWGLTCRNDGLILWPIIPPREISSCSISVSLRRRSIVRRVHGRPVSSPVYVRPISLRASPATK